MKENREYEAPRIRDLEELGIRGESPLGVQDNCSNGSHNVGHVCASGSGTELPNDPCPSGTA